MLKAAHDAIKQADPRARIVLAGLPNYSWLDLGRIYRVPGARNLFDEVAIHPYTKDPSGVIKILGLVRIAMGQSGDAKKPLIADEISWPSSQGKTSHNVGYDFATTESGQAKNIAAMLPLLVKNRNAIVPKSGGLRYGIAGFDYYDWAGRDRPNILAFDFSGLLHFGTGGFKPKPAFSAFEKAALSMEACRYKLVATRCSSTPPPSGPTRAERSKRSERSERAERAERAERPQRAERPHLLISRRRAGSRRLALGRPGSPPRTPERRGSNRRSAD